MPLFKIDEFLAWAMGTPAESSNYWTKISDLVDLCLERQSLLVIAFAILVIFYIPSLLITTWRSLIAPLPSQDMNVSDSFGW